MLMWWLVAAAPGPGLRSLALPEVTLAELGGGDAAVALRLRYSLAEHGAVAIIVPGIAKTAAVALGALPACYGLGNGALSPFRSSVAASIKCGVSSEVDVPQCADVLAPLRALLGKTTDALFGALDAGPGGALGMGREGGGAYGSLRELAAAGEQLEHFHIYQLVAAKQPASGEEAAWTLPLHTDAGVFAIMTAGVYVRADGSAVSPPADGGLFLKLRSGELVSVAQAAPDAHSASVIVIVGEGAANWLRSDSASPPLRAAPHALRVGTSSAGQPAGLVRAWHGRMLLPPSDALLPSGISFGQHRKAEAAAIAAAPLTRPAAEDPYACSPHALLPPGRAAFLEQPAHGNATRPASAAARRLIVAWGAGEECTTTGDEPGIKCWMACISVASLALECPQEEVGCYDIDLTQFVDGTDHCPSSPKVDKCKIKCVPPPPSPPPGPVDSSTTSSGSDANESKNNKGKSSAVPSSSSSALYAAGDVPFCVGGGVTMYMEGFASTLRMRPLGDPKWRAEQQFYGEDGRAECVTLFVAGWVLDSELKFGFGCIAIFLLGIFVEAVASARARVGRAIKLGPRAKQALILLCHGGQLAVGYLLMLAAMTYSTEIFLMTIFGLLFGHALFFRPGDLPASVDPCCATSNKAPGGKPIYLTHVDAPGPSEA
ncbi:hypothetical protein T492DRAFT_1142082 [Pavlovales sp. CCMP2436]|nr:hypothetical protein T492DRAFT_1142082 [Pavlovales sp. CCMP2436]